MEHKIQYLIALISLVILGVGPSRVWAQYQGEIGKEEILVDKKIREFKNNEIADNFDKSQKVFLEGETVEFLVRVENNSTEVKSKIEVTDLLPNYLKLIFYPGTYNKDKNTVEWEIESLGAGESKTFNIRALIDGVPNYITVNNPKQLTNVARVEDDTDRASYFVASKSVPVTGDVDLMVKTGVTLGLVVSGWYLRKFARGY